MKNLTFIVFFFIVGFISAQDIEYYYDAAGNRTIRKVIVVGGGGGGAAHAPHKKQDNYTESLAPELEITIYPNPFQEKIKLQAVGNFEPYQLTVTDMSGKVIVSEKVTKPNKELSLTATSKGIYFLRTTLNGQFKEWKIIKQ